MSPTKKPPRPVTRWIILWDDGDLGSSVWPRKPGKGYIRCRITPIRPATDAEIERLALVLFAAGCGDRDAAAAQFGMMNEEHRRWWRSSARAAWKKGARP